MTHAYPLDRPVWSSLKMGWSSLAQGSGQALRLNPDYGPFGAAADESPQSMEALAALVPADAKLWVVQKEALPPLPGIKVLKTALVHQMVARRIAPPSRPADFVQLGEADAAEMQALALLTEPGPFAALTYRLGEFVGVKVNGKLVAMAGERMRIDGFTEVSGVCTHPDYRGHGYARALMQVVADRIQRRGETPFLHSYASNNAGIALHESVGFRLRIRVYATVLVRG